VSKNLSEDHPDKRTAANEFGTRQLFRRPSPRGKTATLHIKVFGDTQFVTAGDSKFVFEVGRDMDLTELVDVESFVSTVSSSGLPTCQIRNITQAVDMLTTKVGIDVSEFVSKTALTQPVISTTNADVAWGDLIAIDVDVSGTNAKGLGVILTFR